MQYEAREIEENWHATRYNDGVDQDSKAEAMDCAFENFGIIKYFCLHPFHPCVSSSQYLCAQCEEVVLSKNLASLTRHAWSAYRL